MGVVGNTDRAVAKVHELCGIQVLGNLGGTGSTATHSVSRQFSLIRPYFGSTVILHDGRTLGKIDIGREGGNVRHVGIIRSVLPVHIVFNSRFDGGNSPVAYRSGAGIETG